GRRHEAVRGQDALVTGADAQGAQRYLDRVGPVRHADAMPDAAELGVFALERCDLRAADKSGPAEYLLPPLGDLRRHGLVLRRQVNERNPVHRAPPAGARSPRSSCWRIVLTALKSWVGAVPRQRWYRRWTLYRSRPAPVCRASPASRARDGRAASQAAW